MSKVYNQSAPEQLAWPTGSIMTIDIAKAYVNVGWPVIALATGTRIPLKGSHGYKDGTTDITEITQLFKENPNANIGIVTGAAADIVVVDIDMKNGKDGSQAIKALESENGYLPETFTVKTPNAGVHLYFKTGGAKIPKSTDAFPGIDILGEGSYVTAPPSSTSDGKYILVKNIPLATIPDWLVKLIAQPDQVNGSKPQDSDLSSPYSGFPKGKRGEGIYKYACRMAGKGISYEEAKCLVLTKAANCAPPLPETEALGHLDSAYKQHGPIQESITLKSATQLIADEIPQPTWLVPNLLSEGLTLLAGRPKTGKSFLALQIATEIASGANALGHFPVDPTPVIFFGLEDTEARLQNRLLEFGLDDAENLGLLQFSIHLPSLAKGGLDQLEELMFNMNKPCLVIIDTLAKALKPSKSGANEYDHIHHELGPLKSLADRYSSSILALYHTRKNSTSGNPIDDILGTTGYSAVTDTALVLVRDKNGQTTLHATGRDIAEEEYVLVRNGTRWSIAGVIPDHHVKLSPEQNEVLNAVASGQASPKKIAEVLGKGPNAISSTLKKLKLKGMLKPSKHGHYVVTSLGQEQVAAQPIDK